jgi:hypothetical protein
MFVTSNALLWCSTLVAITAILSLTFLRAWRGWLDLRRQETGAKADERPGDSLDKAPVLRIELADMKERLRKLEAIAIGVDL